MAIIAHIDMDAFFAAVEERDHPHLQGLPLVVGADPQEGRGRGVVATANYEARKYGIHSALPIVRAWKISQKMEALGKAPVVFLTGDFAKYSHASRIVMKVLGRYAKLIDPASLDEAYIDLTFVGTFERAEEICRKIKMDIKKETLLIASVGLAANKLVAKIATDQSKPDGFLLVRPEDAEDFLAPLPIRKIPGIGPKTEMLFLKRGVKIVSDLKKYSPEDLSSFLGKWGIELYKKIRGEGSTHVSSHHEVKSIGEQQTFSKDTLDFTFLFGRMSEMCQYVFDRFGRHSFKSFRTVCITVRFADFETKTRSRTLPKPKNDFASLRFEAFRLLAPFFDRRLNPSRKLIRLIGVRMEKLQ